MYNVRYTDHESKCIWHYTWWRNVGLVICVSDIIHDDAMLDSWSVYLTLYMMTQCWTRDLYLTLYMMTQCWTRDLCIWHYTEWCWTRDLCIWHLQNDAMLDSWSVYLTLYRMASCWTRDLCIWHLQNDAMLDSWSVYLTLYKMMPCWTRDLCIWHCTEWRHVGLVICASDIVQNDAMLDSWSCGVILYNVR